ncbi:MAG TPA: tetratricopeptide repeat protein [Candidatus Limnocylindria bacterium]|jgi:tetratricopeptide (TPR) repeat protein|nr:tetratricopeptide repeat protein [Candidatus Limnocylindria bacterium]
MRWWLSVLFALVCAGGAWSVRAADAPEQPQYDAALRAFQTGFYDRATKDFAEFTNHFPNSGLKGNAVRLMLYASAEAATSRQEYTNAAHLFGSYAHDFGAAELGLEAYVRQAEMLWKARDPDRAAALIEAPDGLFQQALKAGKPPAWLFRGLMILAEVRRAQNQAPAALAAIEKALPFGESPEEKWVRLRLLVRVAELGSMPTVALDAATQMETLSQDASLAPRRAESVALLGDLLFQQKQPDKAVDILEKNLAASVPPDFQRAAAVRLAQWRLDRGETKRAQDLLEKTLFGLANLPESAPLRLLLGQVLFRRYTETRGTNAPSPEALGILEQSRSQFSQALTNTPPPDLVGALELGRGWCLWEDAVINSSKDRMAEAAAAFRRAGASLQPGEAQATARYKLADATLWRGEDGEAATNYMAVVEGYTNSPAVQEQLVPLALGQAVIAAVRSTNAPVAQRAMELLLKSDRSKEVAGRSALLIGSMLERAGQGQGVRALYEGFLSRFPDSAVRPDLELELAIMAIHAEPLTNGLARIESWLNSYTNHKELTRAEWEYAWSLARAGQRDAALGRFKKLTLDHPTDKNVRAARLWLAEYFFQQQEYVAAVQACEPITADTTTKDDAWYQAKLYAAESYGKLANWDVSLGHLRDIFTNRLAVPLPVLGRAYFVYGDELIESASGAATDRLAPWRQAFAAYSTLAQLTNSPLVPAALGQMGECQFQLASENPKDYQGAQESFGKALKHPDADIQCRAMASLGLGKVWKKLIETSTAADALALRDRAVTCFLDVAFGKILRTGERIPPRLLNDAAREAGSLLEVSGQIGQAAALYDQMAKEIPSNAAFWNERSAAMRRKVEGK